MSQTPDYNPGAQQPQQPGAGAPIPPQPGPGYPQPGNQPYNAGGPGYYDAAADASQNKVMGVLAYLGILVLVPLFAAKDSRFARYHANQGLVLLICEIAYGVLSGVILGIFAGIIQNLSVLMIVSSIVQLVYLVFVVFLIIGIVNAVKGQTKPLPIIGGITILK